MKLLVVSHPASMPVNQEPFAKVQRHLGGDLTIVVPRHWRDVYGERESARWPGYEGSLVRVPVLLPGNIALHVYRARMRELLLRERPDLIYIHHEPFALATLQICVAARRSGFPIGFYSAQNTVKRYPAPVRAAERYVHRRASFATVVSKETAAALRTRGYRGSIYVVPLGVHTAAFAPDGAHPRRQRDGPLVVGYIGRIADEKGIDTLIEAIRRTPPGSVVGLIAGDGPARARLQVSTDVHGLSERVRWLGYVPHSETASFYARVDVLVVPSKTTPSWKEQFGRVLIESLAAGTPVITSDSGELPRLIQQTGGGWTFPEGNDIALGALLERVAASPDERASRARTGAASVKRLFDSDVVAGQMAELMRFHAVA